MADRHTGDEPSGPIGTILGFALGAIVLIALGLGAGWLLFGDDGDGTDLATEDAASTDDEADRSDDGTDDVEATDDGATDTEAEDGTGATTQSTAEGARTLPAAETDTGPTTTVAGLTTVTAESDEDDETVDDEALNTPTTDASESEPPTTSPPTSGDCRIRPADLNGRSGVVQLDSGGACDAVELTVQAVTDSADLGSVDWSADLKLCEKHPASGDLTVTVTTESGANAVEPTFFRGDVQPGSDLVQHLDIGFPDGFAPGNGVQPIVVCRTSDAEVVIVHRSIG